MTTTAPAPTETDPRPTSRLGDQPADEQVVDATDLLESVLDTLTTATDSDMSLAALGILIDKIDAARTRLDHIKTDAIDRAAALPHDKDTVVPGIGVLSFTYKSNRTRWDDTLVIDALREQARVNTSTGQVLDAPDPETLLMLLGKCARLDWRVTTMREYLPDLDVDEVRTVTKGPLTARIIR